jgi:hypothetical protein
MAVRDPDALPRRIIDVVLAILLLVFGGTYWKAYLEPEPSAAAASVTVLARAEKIEDLAG